MRGLLEIQGELWRRHLGLEVWRPGPWAGLEAHLSTASGWRTFKALRLDAAINRPPHSEARRKGHGSRGPGGGRVPAAGGARPVWCSESQLNAGTPPFIVLCFLVFFYELKVGGSPVTSKSIGVIFPTAFPHFLSLCHVLVILSIFSDFVLILLCVAVIGHPWLQPAAGSGDG